MTIMELYELKKLIADKKHLLLVAGPCYRCKRSKTKVVKAILDQRDHLITHLVTDSRCVRQMALDLPLARSDRARVR